MKSEKGLTLVALVVMIIVLMLLAGVSTYVALTSNDTGNNSMTSVNQVENEVN